MKRYEAYKPSNLPWVAEIPSGWKISKNSQLFRESSELSEKGEEPLLSLSQYTGISYKSNAAKIGMREADSKIGYRVIHEDDIVMNIMLAWNGSTAVSPFDGIISPAYAVYRQRTALNPKYFHYLFRIPAICSYFESNSTGLIKSRLRLYSDSFMRLFSIFPPREEQDQIVRYLDWQVSKINRLIAAKRKQIKLLEATTAHYLENTIHKGTRNEQLVETGNPWINSAPISWKKVRHKNVLTEKKEVVGENHSQYTLLSLTTKGVIIRDTSSGKGKYPSDFSTYQVVNPSNMVFCLFDVDETPRTVGLSTHTGMITGAYTVYETHDALPEYLLYYFLSVDNKKGFKPLYSGLRKVIGKDVFSRQAIYLPSIEEQKEIVDAIQIRQAKSRNAIDLLEREIESLHDLRTRLISDVVTGQVDVRGIKVPDDEYINNEITEEEFEETEEN